MFGIGSAFALLKMGIKVAFWLFMLVIVLGILGYFAPIIASVPGMPPAGSELLLWVNRNVTNSEVLRNAPVTTVEGTRTVGGLLQTLGNIVGDLATNLGFWIMVLVVVALWSRGRWNDAIATAQGGVKRAFSMEMAGWWLILLVLTIAYFYSRQSGGVLNVIQRSFPLLLVLGLMVLVMLMLPRMGKFLTGTIQGAFVFVLALIAVLFMLFGALGSSGNQLFIMRNLPGLSQFSWFEDVAYRWGSQVPLLAWLLALSVTAAGLMFKFGPVTPKSSDAKKKK